MRMTENGYEINEKDTIGVMNFLKIYDGKNATAEAAINFLIFLKNNLRDSMSTLDPDEAIELYEQFKKN